MSDHRDGNGCHSCGLPECCPPAECAYKDQFATYEHQMALVQLRGLRDRIRFAFTDGLDGAEFSEDDHRFIMSCLDQALDAALKGTDD